jgi:hypothetical protein
LSDPLRPDRLARALAAIDARNGDDPNTLEVRGETRPKELAHAELMSEWIARLVDEPSEALQLAARAHHIRRWAIPRSDFASGREGYHRWRKAMHAMHADEVASLLTPLGYARDTIERVQAIVQKKNLRRDEEVQAFEDALCLVFVETQLGELAAKTEPEKLVDIVRKTLAKMTPGATRRALELPLTDAERTLLLRAAAPN